MSYDYSDAEWKEILSTALELMSKAVIEFFKSEDKDFDLDWKKLYSEYILAAISKNISMLPRNGRQDN